MAGLVPAIHVFLPPRSMTWMPGTSSAKTRFALLPGHDELHEPLKRLPRTNIVRARGGRRCAALLGGLVVQFDHDAIGIIDEDLPEIAARYLPRVEFKPPGLQPLLHAGKSPADEGDVMDHAGIRLLRLIGLGNIDQMHHRLALGVHPRPGKGEVRPGALLQAQHILIEPDRVGELAGPDVEMVELTYAHAHALSLPCY